MLAVLGVLIFFMFRNAASARPERRAARARWSPARGHDQLRPLRHDRLDRRRRERGDARDRPGVVLKVHRQTLAKVVTDDAVEDGSPRSVEDSKASRLPRSREREAASTMTRPIPRQPEFGERTDSTDDKPKKRSVTSNTTSVVLVLPEARCPTAAIRTLT